MDALAVAVGRALEASRGHAAAAHVGRAAALARFEVWDPDNGPLCSWPLSVGVPKAPVGPLLGVLGDDELSRALEALQAELVWAADCAEYTDAGNNARQYLRAAGHVELAARAVAGPKGLRRWPARLVRELAAATGLNLASLVPAMGMFPPGTGVQATFAWDVHHEAPITDPQRLGARELTSYHVPGGIELRAPVLAPQPLGARLNDVTTPEALAALAPVDALELTAALGAPDAYARTVDVHMSHWELTTPSGPLTFSAWTVTATLDGAPTGERLPSPPAGRAGRLAPGDVVRTLRAG